jgi:transcriptional regulator with XRE-family HTH domain
MNLPLARRLASEGLSLKDAAKRMGISGTRLDSIARKYRIPFAAATRRPSDWEAPEGDPEALRQWYAGHIKNGTWGYGRGW